MKKNTHEKLLTINEASEILGVSISTLRRWEKSGLFVPDGRTPGNQRRYKFSTLRPQAKHNSFSGRKTIAYARACSKEHLCQQEKTLMFYCQSNEWDYEIVSEVSSSIDFYQRGLKKIIDNIVNNNSIGRIIFSNRSCLTRFGSEIIFAICESKNIEVVIINQNEEVFCEEEPPVNMHEIVSLLLANGHKTKKAKDSGAHSKN